MGMLDGIRSIEELELDQQRVLVRADFDAALGADVAAIERDVKALLPTLSIAQAKGARVVIASHAGSLEQKPSSAGSLEPVAERLSELLGTEIYLPDDAVGDAARKVVQDLRPGQVCLLENLGLHAEEMANDDGFAHKLARYADVFVNDALRASRSSRSSIDTLSRLLPRRGAGARLAQEIKAIERVREAPSRTLAFVAGSSDAAAELQLIECLLERTRVILAGGALGITLLSAVGTPIGSSPVDPGLLARSRALLVRARDAKVELKLPIDLLALEGRESSVARPVAASGLSQSSIAVGVGPKTIAAFAERLVSEKTVLVTGPLGLTLKTEDFSESLRVFRTIVESDSSCLVVGFDTPSAIERADSELASKIGCVSTGGSSTLELLAGRKLPGIEALRGGAT